ncbi:MAG: hypothetical protein LBP67_03805 [Bacteroidales bacterium]|jgi:F-type H+-transporting ATPase subunit epsilon|nr:hypothetical protein [Bacteroidales bacterium]
MKLKILSPEKTIYDGNADSVLVPGKNNKPFVILDSHTPLISILENGLVRYTVNGKDVELLISSGFVEVRKDVVSVCVEL